MALAVRVRLVLTLPQEAMVRHQASVTTIASARKAWGGQRNILS